MPLNNTDVMPISDLLSLLGRAINQIRLAANKSEKEVASLAGVSLRTLQRLIKGKPAGTNTLLRVLRVLGKLELLSPLIQNELPSPIALLKNKLPRKRVRISIPRIQEGSDQSKKETVSFAQKFRDMEIALSDQASIRKKYRKNRR